MNESLRKHFNSDAEYQTYMQFGFWRKVNRIGWRYAETESKLAELGITLFGSDGQLKNWSDLLHELSVAWDKLPKHNDSIDAMASGQAISEIIQRYDMLPNEKEPEQEGECDDWRECYRRYKEKEG